MGVLNLEELMKRCLPYFLALLLSTTLNADDNGSENSSSLATSDASQPEESGLIEQIINTIAEAAISDRDAGKDIGDR